MKNKSITKIVSALTFVMIIGVLLVILLLNSNGGVKADTNRSTLTISKSSTITIYVSGVGVDLVSTDSFKDEYSIEQSSTVVIQAVNESHIFTGWSIKNSDGVDVTSSLLGTTISNSKDSFTMPDYDIEVSCSRNEAVTADYGKYMRDRFIITTVDELVALQNILVSYSDVSAETDPIVASYDKFFGNVEDYKNDKVGFINKQKLVNNVDDGTSKAYYRLQNGYFLIANNLSVFSNEFYGIGTSAHPFNGVVCGNSTGEYSQVVLVITDTADETNAYGLFAYLGSNAIVRNLRVRSSIGITSAKDSGDIYAGGLAAVANNSLLVDLDVTGNINISSENNVNVYAGGFIGKSNETSVDDISNLSSGRDNGSVIVSTLGNSYSGYFAGYGSDSYVKELDLNISGLNMTTRNTGSENTNIYSGIVFGYLENTKRIVLEDIDLTSTINFKIDNFANDENCYTGGIAGYVNGGASIELGSICIDNKAVASSIIRGNTQNNASTGNVYTAGLFAYISGTNVIANNSFKNRIKVVEVDGKDAYVYNPIFSGNITIEGIQNGKADGSTYGKVISGGIVGKGFININGADTDEYADGETHLVLSKVGTLDIKATQSSLASHNSYSYGTSDIEHCVSSMVFGIVSNSRFNYEFKNINVYGETVNVGSTREIGSYGMGDVATSCFTTYANGISVDNINLYLNNCKIESNSLSYVVKCSTAHSNNTFTGALLARLENGIFDSSDENNYKVETYAKNSKICGVNWDNLKDEVGTKLKIRGVQNTIPGGGDYKGENYIGSFVGQLYRASVYNLNYIGSESEEDYIVMGGHENPDSAFCGGIAGFIKCNIDAPSNQMYIQDCSIKNAAILGEATITGVSSPDIYVGGIVGAAYVHQGETTKFNFISNSVINSSIKAVGNESINVRAGGLLGGITWSSTCSALFNSCYVLGSNISASVNGSSTDYNAAVGGIVGSVSNLDATYTNNAIIDTSIKSTEYVAGFTAFVSEAPYYPAYYYSDNIYQNNYSNAVLDGDTIYGISNEDSATNTYYVKHNNSYAGIGTALSFAEQKVNEKNDSIFSDLNTSEDYLNYVLSYNNGYQSNVTSVSFTGSSSSYYEDVLNVWVNFKGQGQSYPLDLPKTKEELASEGWFNMGEKIIYNDENGNLSSKNSIQDEEVLYGYNNTESTTSRENRSNKYEYVETVDTDKIAYSYDVYVHEKIAYYKLKFYAQTTTDFLPIFSKSLVGYGTYEFTSSVVTKNNKEMKEYVFILYPNAEISSDYSTVLSFVDSSGYKDEHTFTFNFKQNKLNLVGVTYASYTPPLNYYEIENGDPSTYSLSAGSITKFIPKVTKQNDLKIEGYTEEDYYYIDEKYIELVGYSTTSGTIKSSGELTAPDSGTGTVTLSPKSDSILSGTAQTVTFKVFTDYTVTYSVIGMTTDCIPYASASTNYYFPIYVDNGYAGNPDTATIKIGTATAQNITTLITNNKVDLLDENGAEVSFSDDRTYYLLRINTGAVTGNVEITIKFPIIYTVTFDLQCGSFNPDCTEMTKVFKLRNTQTFADYFGYTNKAYALYITEEQYVALATTDKDNYSSVTIDGVKYYYLTDTTNHITYTEYEELTKVEKESYICYNETLYIQLNNWVNENRLFGYVFTGFYMVDNANDEPSYGEGLEEILDISGFKLNTSLTFYARWSFLIELVEAPGTLIKTSFADSFMYQFYDSDLVNRTVKVPINNNKGYVFSIEKDANYIGEAGVKAYIVTENGSLQVLNEIVVEKYHEDMYLYFIPPEQINGYLMLVTSISNAGLIVGENTSTVTEEILPEDGIMTFKYVANHRYTEDEISYIFNSGYADNTSSNLGLKKEFILKFYKQVYTGSTDVEARSLAEGTVVEVYYQKVVNGSIDKRIVGRKIIDKDNVSSLLLSEFTLIEGTSPAFPNETFNEFLGSVVEGVDKYVSEVYYFVVTPPNGLEGNAKDQIYNYSIEGGYIDTSTESGYVEGVRSTHDFVNIPIDDWTQVQKESSRQVKIYSVTPSRETILTFEDANNNGNTSTSDNYNFTDKTTYEIFRISTTAAGIEDGKLRLLDEVGYDTIIESQALPFGILTMKLTLGYNTGYVNVYAKEADADTWVVVGTINVTDMQYQTYTVNFPAGEYKYFKIDNISGKEIRVQDLTVVSNDTAMTYIIDLFEFETGTTQIVFKGDVINDVRHDGKQFLLAVQLENNGEIVDNLPDGLTIKVMGLANDTSAIEATYTNGTVTSNQQGRVTAYFNLSECLAGLNADNMTFVINIPSGYTLHAVQLLEAENVNKPAMSEVRETIVK